MSPVLDTDLFLAQRSATLYHTTAAWVRQILWHSTSDNYGVNWTEPVNLDPFAKTMQVGVDASVLGTLVSFGTPVPPDGTLFRFTAYYGSGYRQILAIGPSAAVAGGKFRCKILVPAGTPAGTSFALYLELPAKLERTQAGIFKTV